MAYANYIVKTNIGICPIYVKMPDAEAKEKSLTSGDLVVLYGVVRLY
jgi:hypothetical protein